MNTRSGVQWVMLIGLGLALVIYHLTNPLLEDAVAVWRIVQLISVVVIAFFTVRWKPIARLVCKLAGVTYIGGTYEGTCKVHENDAAGAGERLTLQFTIRQSPERLSIQGTSRREGVDEPFSNFDGIAFEAKDDLFRFAIHVNTDEGEYGVLVCIASPGKPLKGHYYSAICDADPNADRKPRRVWAWSAATVDASA